MLAIIVSACGGGESTKVVDPNKKMGTILKRQIDGLKDGEFIVFSAFCTKNIDKDTEAQLRATGAEIRKLVDNYIIASATKEQTYAIASLPFVERLEGSSLGTFRK